MIPEQYVWLVWSSVFLIPWGIFYVALPKFRRPMLWSSLFTTPFGLTEPLFVPEYWNPPSLFDLAQKTGFDIESLIFCFGIGGIGSVLYNALAHRSLKSVPTADKSLPLHRHHFKALASPFIAFPIFYFFPWNPIYPSIIAMFVGAIANILCRPDLKTKTWWGGLLFFAFYSLFLLGLEWTAPGYINKVWNLTELSGLMFFRVPVEELLFAIGFGMYWSGVYEHFTWKRTAPE